MSGIKRWLCSHGMHRYGTSYDNWGNPYTLNYCKWCGR